VTQAVNLGNKRMEYTGYFYSDGTWKLLSRMETSTNNDEEWWFRSMSSYIWPEVRDETARVRAARFGPTYIAGTSGESFEQITSSDFYFVDGPNDDHVAAYQVENAVGIATGGNIQQGAEKWQTFNYPQVLPHSVLISFQLSISCLNGANNSEEIEICIDCLNAGTNEDITSCLPTSSPTSTPSQATAPILSASPSDIPSDVTSSGLGATGIGLIVGGSVLFVAICIGIIRWYQKRDKYIPGDEENKFPPANTLLSKDTRTRTPTNAVEQSNKTTTLRASSLPARVISTVTPEFDLFLTHNWGPDESGRDNHNRVRLINLALRKENISTWFDDDRMRGDITLQMTNGIDKSRVVIVFVTETYIKKVHGKGASGGTDNCKVEFDYSIRRKNVGKIITVVMEESCLNAKAWEGAVGAYLGGRLYINFTDNTKLDSCIDQIKEELRKIIHDRHT